MKWSQLREKWVADPEFRAAYAAEYPHEADADRLMEKRAALGLTQEQFAAHLEVNLVTLRRWESGKSPVPRWVFA